MNWHQRANIIYKMYGRFIMKIVMIGVIVLSITYMSIDNIAHAYSLWDISANYGDVSSIHPNGHSGVDFVIPSNTELKSVVDGTVERVRDTGDVGYGKSVQIRTEDGRLVIYGHLNEWSVQEGDVIKEGQIIGRSGNTGRSTGSHLHFEVRKDGVSINPMPTVMEGNINKLYQNTDKNVATLESLFKRLKSK